MPFAFDSTYARLPARFFARVQPTPVARPSLLAVNTDLAELLHLTREELASPEGVEILAGNRVPEGAEPIALAYAGHQFGGFVPQLGDGRAILLGEIVGRDGRRYDIQLKGPGRTPFSRGGDGRAALGPVLREYVVSEAMFTLGVPTTRSLAAVATGEQVYRETPLPGAVLTRVASSHIRIGTFQYFAVRKDREALEQLTDHALARHYPQVPRGETPALSLFDSVVGAQSRLVAHWLAVGFVHGVMNTDNATISGETIDYGPCAFLDTYDPRRFFSSIDHGGRYAFANQPRIALWNLARLAETLLPLVHDDAERAAAILTERLETFPSRFEAAYTDHLRRKLGLTSQRDGDRKLAQTLLDAMAEDRVDYTLCFRRLCDLAASASPGPSVALPASAEVVSGRLAAADRVAELFRDPPQFHAWTDAWRARLAEEPTSAEGRAALMRSANPAFIPRNHRVEEMITAAASGDMGPFERLRRALARPYEDQPDAADLMDPPGEEQWSYQTFCGT